MTQFSREDEEQECYHNRTLSYMVCLATLNLHIEHTLMCLNYCYWTF